jgi:AcrR family transcriptional regulator
MPIPEDLLQKCLAYFLKHGVANLSLRPLAAAAGTSARMLLHHFGSKERLIATVMDRVRSRLQISFESAVLAQSHADCAEVMLAFWKLTTSRKYRPYLKLLFEVQILAIQNPTRYAQYLSDTSASWVRVIERTLPSGTRRQVTATLATAVLDGLMLEYLSTGDLRRTSQAVKLFLELLMQPKTRKER